MYTYNYNTIYIKNNYIIIKRLNNYTFKYFLIASNEEINDKTKLTNNNKKNREKKLDI